MLRPWIYKKKYCEKAYRLLSYSISVPAQNVDTTLKKVSSDVSRENLSDGTYLKFSQVNVSALSSTDPAMRVAFEGKNLFFFVTVIYN